MGRKIKKYFKNMNVDTDSYIWVAKDNCQPLYMVLWYNGVKIAKVSEENGTVKVVFFCTKRQSKRIRKDIRNFNVVYKAANWAC